MIAPHAPGAFAIGLDIGGTSMVAGVIAARTGQALSRASVPTESRNGHADGLQRIGALIEQVAADAHVQISDSVGIGIGCTGPVDSIRGLIQNPFTLPGWDDLPLVEHLQARFDRPVSLLNDCHVAALGENWIGAGRGSQHMIYITVGTGIGSGLILDGRLYRGNDLLSGEVGHMAIDPAGPLCYCGARGCVEVFAAGPAIASFAANAVPTDSQLWAMAGQQRAQITAQLVCATAADGDSFALSVVDRAATALGIGIANLLNVLTPEVVVMGGGVMQSWPLFQPIVERILKERAGMLANVQSRIVPAALGLNAGITGAAYAALHR